MLFGPGADETYSNYGYGVLGLALRTASGLGYDQLLQQRLTGPLGMNSTWQTLPADQKAHLVPRYDSFLAVHGPLQLDALQGCGGVISCIDDMLAWLRAILDVDPAVSDGCGFFWRAFGIDPERGWAAFPKGGRTGAAGRSWGYKSSYLLYPHQRIGVVILSNTNSFEIDTATEELARGLLEAFPSHR